MDHQLFLEAFASLGPLLTSYILPDLSDNINDGISDFNKNDKYDDNENKKSNYKDKEINYNSSNNNNNNNNFFINTKFYVTLSIAIISFILLILAFKNYLMGKIFFRKLNAYEYVSVNIDIDKIQKNKKMYGNNVDNSNDDNTTTTTTTTNNNNNDNSNNRFDVRTYGSMGANDRTKKYFIQNENEMNNLI